MKLTIEKSDLQRGLSRLQAVVEKRSSMPILANVLLEAEGRGDKGHLELVAAPQAQDAVVAWLRELPSRRPAEGCR